MEELTRLENDIYELAKPYLAVRNNDAHVRTSLGYALRLLGRVGGDRRIVVPAMILHDVGWFVVGQQQFDQWVSDPDNADLVGIHEREGGEIASGILEKCGYETSLTEEIVRIVRVHDSGGTPTSTSEAIVRDADVLWRYSKSGFGFIVEMFRSTPDERLTKLVEWLEDHFFLPESREIAEQELWQRRDEIDHSLKNNGP